MPPTFKSYIPPALFVTWQDPESRTIFPVGRLVRFGGAAPHYEFTYLQAVRDAEERGFTPFLSFPTTNQVYRSREMPPFFQNRLMPRTRADFAAHLEELGLDAGATSETILARTGGRRATDPYEVFAEFEPISAPGEWQTWFFARSLRYLAYPEAIAKLVPGQRLYCLCDVQNPVDRQALALRTESNALVGYAPSYLVDDVSPVLNDPKAVTITVARVNPEPAPLQNRLQCHLSVRPGEDFHAYRTGRFEPVAQGATPLGPWVRTATAA